MPETGPHNRWMPRSLRQFEVMNRKLAPIFLVAALTGAATGGIAAALLRSVSLVDAGRAALAGAAEAAFGGGAVVSMLLSAAMTVGAVALVRFFAPEAAGSGIQEIEGTLEGLRTLRPGRVLPVKLAGGILSLGSGLSLGREGPTIHMGGALGRLLGRLCRQSDPQVLHSLVAAGAAAGLAAAFNAPLAGILFVMEEMRREFHFNFVSFHCVVIAAVVADVMVRLLLNAGPAIAMTVFPVPHVQGLWLFFLFGVLLGGVGVVFNRLLLASLRRVDRAAVRWPWLFALTVGAAFGLIAWFYPDLAGGGYHVLHHALTGQVAVALLVLLFVCRFAGTLFCYATSAPGGIFAPMLALGTLLGMAFGQLAVGLGLATFPGMFAVAGMGALFAATVRAPLTGMVLIMEMTRNYALTLPLLVTCIASVVTAETLGGRPIYSLLLDRTLRREQDTAASR
ncbi:MAG: H(+)/Cl(-) exchange transporter ClcA [Desulfovibrio sp.]